LRPVDAQDQQPFAVLLGKALHHWHLGAAGRAPSRPEVDPRQPAAAVLDGPRAPIQIIGGKRRRRLTDEATGGGRVRPRQRVRASSRRAAARWRR
ncbi:MAG: hypothetical protein ABJC24_03205, partial [Chloroflexota bacterium]